MIKLIINWTLFFLLFPIWFPFWLSCRLAAKNCPQCRSKWQVELVGEWDGEDWYCHRCIKSWTTK